MLDWHRREYKAQWWEYFRLQDLSEEELLDEPKAIAGLQFVGEVERVKKSTVFRYSAAGFSFPGGSVVSNFSSVM